MFHFLFGFFKRCWGKAYAIGCASIIRLRANIAMAEKSCNWNTREIDKARKYIVFLTYYN